MQTFDLKKQFTEGYGWNKDFKFEIVFSEGGLATIFVDGIETKYNIKEYGSDKVSKIIATMINDLIGKQPYNPFIYGNSGNNNKEGETEFYLKGEAGYNSIKESFESIKGNSLNCIYTGSNSTIYEIKFNQVEA